MSPMHQMASAPAWSAEARTASSAGRFACTSEMRATFMRGSLPPRGGTSCRPSSPRAAAEYNRRVMQAVVLLSGGLDSTTVATHAVRQGHEVRAISVAYGQRHDRELQSARKVAEAL